MYRFVGRAKNFSISVKPSFLIAAENKNFSQKKIEKPKIVKHFDMKFEKTPLSNLSYFFYWFFSSRKIEALNNLRNTNYVN